MDIPVQPLRVATETRLWPPQSPRERLAYSVIIGAGVLCFVLLAWVHLGVGAMLFPPAATARQQVARAGDYNVTLQLNSGQLTADGANTLTLTLTLRDAAGRPANDATLQVQPVMTSMSMAVPVASATPTGAGIYTAHPKFGMAGTWRLDVEVTSTDGSTHTASFTIAVRWS